MLNEKLASLLFDSMETTTTTGSCQVAVAWLSAVQLFSREARLSAALQLLGYENILVVVVSQII